MSLKAHRALGYRVYGPIWESPSVTISPDLGGTVNALVADCKDTWNSKLIFCNFQYQYSNTSPYNVFWVDILDSTFTGGCALETFPPNPQTEYWDTVNLYFNGNPIIKWCYGSHPGDDEYHFKSVCKHEMGHAAGLAHSNYGIMFPTRKGEVRNIDSVDVSGIACLYGTLWKKRGKEAPCHYEVYLESSSPEEEPPDFHRCTTRVHLSCCEGGSSPSHTVKLYITYDGGSSWHQIWKRNSIGRHRRIKVYFTQSSGNAQIKAKWYDNGTPFAEDTTKTFRAYYRQLACPPIPIQVNNNSESSNKTTNSSIETANSEIKDNAIYSIYDKLGRSLIRHKSGSVIKEFIKTKDQGIYFLRKEYPGSMEIRKITIIK